MAVEPVKVSESHHNSNSKAIAIAVTVGACSSSYEAWVNSSAKCKEGLIG